MASSLALANSSGAMNLDLPRGLSWRHAQINDAEAILSLIQIGAKTLQTISTMQVEDVQAILQSPRFAAKGSCLIFTEQLNEPVLLGFSWLLTSPFQPRHAEVWFQIHPNPEQYGCAYQTIEQALFFWLNEIAEHHFHPLITIPSAESTAACWLFGSSWQDDRQRCTTFLRYGFYPLRFYAHMQCDLLPLIHSPLPIPSSPFSVQPFEHHHTYSIHQLYRTCFQDDWLFQNKPYQAWEEQIINSKHFLPNLSFTAWAEKEMFGFLLSEEHTAANLRTAHITSIGVAPAYRSQGAAKTLLYTALNAYADQRYSFATLDADTDNHNQVIEFYHSAGFRPMRMKVYFGKPLDLQQASINDRYETGTSAAAP